MSESRNRKSMAGALDVYRSKRDFQQTPEPPPRVARRRRQTLSYVVQEHHASHLHYDFRLELNGVLLSWAVPKGPSADPAVRRMAVRTEDHPLAYGNFEGTIPKGHYGAGTVTIWDRGHWRPAGDPDAGLRDGKLGFELQGERLQGHWELVRTQPKPGPGRRQESWLLFKKREAPAAPGPAELPPLAALPQTLIPQLATLAESVPESGAWIFETKYDGYRLLARIEAGKPRLYTRNGHDWSDRLPALVDALKTLRVGEAWFDGEIIARAPHESGAGGAGGAGDQGGAGDFNRLQNAFDDGSTATVEYRLFDLPYFEGHDLRSSPLKARRELLAGLLAARPSALLQFSSALAEAGGADAQRTAERLLRSACAAGHEGLIAKLADAPYRSRRDAAWLKLKCRSGQEFVVAGYTLRGEDPTAVGSLILGTHDDAGHLQHAGRVGTGWDRATARHLLHALDKLPARKSPFEAGAPASGGRPSRGRRTASPSTASTAGAVGAVGAVHWVKPTLVAEVRFGEWTPTGHIRHASFVALRDDKPAREIVRERPQSPQPEDHSAAPAPTPASTAVRLTHPKRVVDPISGTTKADLLRYYERVAGVLLPELRGRPLALVRAPGGVAGNSFFQKHRSSDDTPLAIDTTEALLQAVQMNAVEFHTGNATAPSETRPDRIVFDLDPGDGVAWPTVCEGAALTRALLHELGLQCWLKTSGGKGLHLVVPIERRWSFETVKRFSGDAVRHLAAHLPERFVAKSGPAQRVGRIFVDYLRNGESATTVAAWSARARPGLGVSMPIGWEQLDAVTGSAQWTVQNAADWLQQRPFDPWREMQASHQSITEAVQRLGRTRDLP